MKTWKDKVDWENAHNPSHAEGYACPPDSLILTEDKKGKQKVITFNPETLSLDTKVLDWHYERKNICTNCNNYVCKAYHGTCRKYRFLKLITFGRYGRKEIK